MKTKKRFLSILLSLALMLGLLLAMSTTAYAAEVESEEFTTNSGAGTYTGTHIKITGTQPLDGDGDFIDKDFPWTIQGLNGEIITRVDMTIGFYGGQDRVRHYSANHGTLANINDSGDGGFSFIDVNATSITIKADDDGVYTLQIKKVVVYYTSDASVAVTGVTLNPSTTQSINVGGSVAFTATVAPDGATDKTVKWSTTGGVTLYSDENCTAGNEIGADATSTLTVYAKGTAAGSATVTATSNADSTKSASCKVTVNAAAKGTPTVNNFTYSAPSNLSYDGTAKTATVVPKEGVTGMGNVTVKYYSDAACTTEVEDTSSVGTYYVGITVTEGDSYNATTSVLHDSSWMFTIGKATPTADDFTFIEPENLSYDGTDKTATVVPGSGVTGMGNVTVKYYSDATCTTEVEDTSSVGTYYVGITVAEGDSYNATTSVLHDSSWMFTIGKASATVTETPTAKTLTANGSAQSLINAGTASGGTMKYAVTTANQEPAAEAYTFDNTSLPTATDAGTYYVWYKVVGDANHFDTEAKCIKSIIKEQPKEEPKEEPKDEPKEEPKEQQKEEPKETPKEVDVTPEVEETTEENSSEEVPTETQSPYRTEWVDGQWYDSEGNATYKPQGKWYQDSTGWWYQDEDGWYPSSQWQKIDGKWYYFTSDGYMDYSEYRDGFWLGSDGAWVETYCGGGWGEKDGQFWYEDATGWYPVSQWLWINGKCYYFGSDGYRVYNQYVNGYWVNNDGEWEP